MDLKNIPFEYCSLERASKFFECEIEDFFHWYDTNKISLSLKLQDTRATVLTINNKSVEFKTEYLGSDHIEYDVMASANNEYSYIDNYSVFVGNRLSFDQLGGVYRVNGYAHDFWKPCDSAISSLRTYGSIVDSFAVSPYDYEGDFRIMVEVNEGFQDKNPEKPLMYHYPSFTTKDIVLHKNDLNIINHLMCGVEFTPEISDKKVEDEISEENIESNIHLEWGEFSGKETSLKFIVGMVLTLSSQSPKYRNGTKINRTAIARDAVSRVIAQGIEFDITERQLSTLINKALDEYAPKTGNL